MTGMVLAVAVAAIAGTSAGLALRLRLGFVTVVDSVSMLPTLAPDQWLLTRRRRPVARGDVVVARSAEVGRTIVKRAVGLAGERVEIGPDGGVVVDGRPLAEPYVRHPGGPSGTFTVPPGHVLLLGDNRARSSDARSWRQPFLPLAAVEGTVIMPGRPR